MKIVGEPGETEMPLFSQRSRIAGTSGDSAKPSRKRQPYEDHVGDPHNAEIAIFIRNTSGT